MEIPDLLKRAIAELDVNLEEELRRYQYWRKYGRAPSPHQKFSQRSQPRPSIPEPVLPQPEPPETTELITEPVVPPSPSVPESVPEQEETQSPWLDGQTIFASIVIMIVLGTVGYIAAEMFTLDRALNTSPPPPPPAPQNQNPPPPVAVKPPQPSNPVSVRPPLPDPTIENLPPVESAPPPDGTIVEQDQPVVVYKVIVDRQYLDRVQQIEPGAFIRPADGTVQVAAFENEEDAKRLLETLREKDIPAQIE